jgi:signal transduction histidine kinase
MTTEADAGLLKQAMRILVDNAAKYTKEGDEILLSSGVLEDGSHYLEVQDTGIGMAEADVQHMFERFYRSDEVRSYQGTGLGLSIAKWIVDKHGGHFEILSRTSLGTRIRIVLP